MKINAAAQSVKLMDPCSPRGYTHNLRSLKLSPSSLADKNRFLSALYPSGNFSECRSASLSLLQKGKGLLLLFPVIEQICDVNFVLNFYQTFSFHLKPFNEALLLA